MNQMLKIAAHQLLDRFGYRITKKKSVKPEPYSAPYPSDFRDEWKEILDRVSHYTMTSPERVYNLCLAVKYISQNSISGSFVECGVWKGGSVMAMALSLLQLGETLRPEIFLFDTFDGMPEPAETDRFYEGTSAKKFHELHWGPGADIKYWAYSPLEEVRRNVLSTGYPAEKFRFVQGMVEDTLAANCPSEIALLRLDTDWFSSTSEEMKVLYPRLVKGGVILIDDYGTFTGAARAVDEYVLRESPRLLLTRIDDGLYMGIKQ